MNVHDKDRSGRPSLVSDDLINKVNQAIHKNHRFTILELSDYFPEISRSLLHERVIKNLDAPHNKSPRSSPRFKDAACVTGDGDRPELEPQLSKRTGTGSSHKFNDNKVTSMIGICTKKQPCEHATNQCLAGTIDVLAHFHIKGVVLGDGGHDSELRKYVGSDFDDHPLWVCRYLLENPEAVCKVNQEYIQCGVSFILTNTYQATVEGFQKHQGQSEEQALALIRRGVSIRRQAMHLERDNGNKRDIQVVGVIGPYGAFLHDGSEYSGGHYADRMTLEQLVDWHKPQFETLVDAGVDSLFFGTIPSQKEAEALLSLLKQHPEMKAFLSFSAQNSETISHGERLSEVAQWCWALSSNQLLAIGVNCLHPRLVSPLLLSVKQANPRIPLLAKPNTTEVFNKDTKQWEVAFNEKTMAQYCEDWIDLGVKYICGCCRTNTQVIKDFRNVIINKLKK